MPFVLVKTRLNRENDELKSLVLQIGKPCLFSNFIKYFKLMLLLYIFCLLIVLRFYFILSLPFDFPKLCDQQCFLYTRKI